jgi:hypothetical protein
VDVQIVRARAGGGPTFIEAYTYRWSGHYGPASDDLVGYRAPEELEAWKRNCPIELLEEALRANGLLVLTTPNRVWQGAVRAASRLRLRPFRGLENFVAWRRLEQWCAAADLEVLIHLGFHPWPFHLGLTSAARTVERRLARGRAARWMVNQAVVARKR